MSVTAAVQPSFTSAAGVSLLKTHGAPSFSMYAKVAAENGAANKAVPTTSYSSTEPGADNPSTRANNRSTSGA